MDQQHGGSSDRSRSGGDADAWRVLLVGLLEKVDLLAAGLLGDDSGARAHGNSGDHADAPGSGDFAAQFRATLEIIVEEAGELIWQMLGQLIAILEAIQQALEHVMGGAPGPDATSSAGSGAGREHAYEPITVQFDSPDGPPTGSV